MILAVLHSPLDPGTDRRKIMLQHSGRTIGFIEPCLPSPAKTPPGGPNWLHEIKRDGFRVLARRDAAKTRTTTRFHLFRAREGN